jgi:hypothetical protein
MWVDWLGVTVEQYKTRLPLDLLAALVSVLVGSLVKMMA